VAGNLLVRAESPKVAKRNLGPLGNKKKEIIADIVHLEEYAAKQIVTHN
jgi:hypothetical protein